MRTEIIILANIVASLFYISNGITLSTIITTVVMVLWNIGMLLLYSKKNIHAVIAILLSYMTTTAWMNQPAGVLLSLMPVFLVLFGGIKGISDNMFIVGWEIRLALIVYGILMYTGKIIQHGFSLQELGIYIISISMIAIAGRNFRHNAMDIKKALAREKIIATRDKLTGLLSRETMENTITETARKIDIFSVIMMDVDKFKGVNDTYGHTNGDLILKDLAKIIKENIKESDFAFRYGGDEFTILCPKTRASEAKDMAENIRKAFSEKKYNFNNETQQFHTSLGLVECKYGEFESATEIIKKADQALYEAKQNGRNTISVYN